MTTHPPSPIVDRRGVSLNLNVRGLRHSATLDIKARVRALRAQGRTVHDLGLGESPFPVPEPLVRALRKHAGSKEYLPVQGLPALREAVADFQARTIGLEATPEQVLVGPGTKELLFLLQLSFYGDLFVPSPSWVSYTPQAQIVGHPIKTIATDAASGWKLSPDAFAQAMEDEADRYRPRLLVLNSPANPTGVAYSDDELASLARVARDYGVLVLSDEIYSGLRFDGAHASIARHYPEGTIVLNGISKWAGAGGWRLGTFTFPPDLDWLQEAMAAVASETYTSVSTPIQHAAVQAFRKRRDITEYQAHCRRILEALATRSVQALRDADVHVVAPDGAFYLFPDFSPLRRRLAARGLQTSKALCNALLEDAGVACLPGSSFLRPPDEPTARMALVDFDGASALRASRAYGIKKTLPDEFVDDHGGSVLAAMEHVARWLQKRTV